MPDHEQLGILCLLGLLAILYFVSLGVKYALEYWYLIVTAITGIVALKIWWRRRHPLCYDDDEDYELEPVPQE